MNPTKPDDTAEEQRTEQRQRKEERNGMQAPVAASRRDVMEAENKAEEAQQQAKNAKRLTVEEIENLRQDLEETRSEVEEAIEELRVVEEEAEQQLAQLFENTSPRQFGKSWDRDPLPDVIEERKSDTE
ncbi:hypothetical protein [Haloarcula sp. Atlit-120R]|uniref:hypothetical protein n=1 Tax=Haloarcula sp. Atlit-120R TaxID=2282135 RepID=UPI000EF1919E|nr:hypothetical protein [Haloarcula sp. Atlit-120R]RLM32554.1 hypothetical protein DVK01_20935 [Haloarcula sp. Atlit-120R]